MILASHQPDFFPYMGYFYKIFQSDIFVFSDNVQYSKSGRHNYNLILTSNGVRKFTIPIHYHCVNLNEIKIAANDSLIKKMMKTLTQEYRKAEYFDEAYPIINHLMSEAPRCTSLADFNQRCLLELVERFGLDNSRDFYLSSNLPLNGRKDARILSMCKYLKADTYLSGTAAKDYHVEDDYQKNDIHLVYSDYQSVVYPQVEPEFAANMSVIDYVFNCGFNLPKEWKKWAL